jgi:hypothetical protein
MSPTTANPNNDDDNDVATLPCHQHPPPTPMMTMVAPPPLSHSKCKQKGGVLDLFYVTTATSPLLAPNVRGKVLIIFLLVLLIYIIIYKLYT